MHPTFQALKGRLVEKPPASIDTQGLKLKEASVLAPLFWRDEEPWAYLTQRPMNLRRHPGQIAFPGGAREEGDATLLHTALRETQEELGILPEQVDVLGMLGSLPVVTGYYVTPFVGVLPSAVALTPDPIEIAEVLEVPLRRLRTERRVIMQAEREVFLYDDGAHVIWGATAYMLKQLLQYF